jgi:hypothetical protein
MEDLITTVKVGQCFAKLSLSITNFTGIIMILPIMYTFCIYVVNIVVVITTDISLCMWMVINLENYFTPTRKTIFLDLWCNSCRQTQ